MLKKFQRVFCAATLFALTQFVTENARAQSPQSRVDELLAADRAFSSAGASKDLVASLSAMFGRDVIMLVPGDIARGKTAAVAALQANAANAQSRIEWTPVRGGISADGLQGFTFGVMNIKRADGTTAGAKYLAYWIKGDDGWRVAAYKRGPRADGVVSTELMAPALPAQMTDPTQSPRIVDDYRASLIAAEKAFSEQSPRIVDDYRASLIAAEKAFSDLAQKIGLGPAFKECGSADAMNLGGAATAGFVIGNANIAELVGRGQPAIGSSVSWSADNALIALSGDLGVTIGFIKPNGPPAAGAPPNGFPFFTIWRRASPSSPWKYIAE